MGRVAVVAVLAAVATGCGAWTVSGAGSQMAGQAAAAAPAASSGSGIDALTQVARRRYITESRGRVAVQTLHRVAGDPVLQRLLRSANVAATRAYVEQQFAAVWYHWHVSRLRVLKGSQAVIDVGMPFVVAPSHMALRGPGGQRLSTLEVSIQDVIGFVRYMHRNYPVDVVVRGQRPGHVRTSLPAAAHVQLPSRGSVTIAGHRYLVRSFQETALGGEPVTAWILTRG
jgi:hypothetical protein